MTVDYKLIGSRIKEERKRRGLTQERLAERLDVSIGYISQVECGKTKISLDLLGRIAELLSCDIASLVTAAAKGMPEYGVAEWSAEFSRLTPEKRKLALALLHAVATSE